MSLLLRQLRRRIPDGPPYRPAVIRWADERAARKAEEMTRLMAEIAAEQGGDGCPT